MAEKTRTLTVENGISFAAIAGTVQDGKDDKGNPKLVPFSYSMPANWTALRAWADSLPETDEKAGKDGNKQRPSQEWCYERFAYAVDLRERAAVREATAAESTIIVVGGKQVDLMGLDPRKGIALVNAEFLQAGILATEPRRAFVVARRRLVEAGTATEKDGALAPKRS